MRIFKVRIDDLEKNQEKLPTQYLNEISGTLYYVPFYHSHSNRISSNDRIGIWNDC